MRQLEHGSIGTRLGEGLRESGTLGDDAMQRTLEAIATFVERARQHDARVSCIATSAVRRASNRESFAGRVAALTGADLHVLDGEAEAAASFDGATYGATPSATRIAVLDVGGGSTECAVGRDGLRDGAVSVEIGAVRLAERYPETTGGSVERARAAGLCARAAAAAALRPFAPLGPAGEVRAVGGTPLTLGAIAFESSADAVSGRTLTRREIDASIERMLGLDLAARRELPGMIAQRADILPAGAIILSEALRVLGCDAARLESNDLLLGYLLRTGPGRANA